MAKYMQINSDGICHFEQPIILDKTGLLQLQRTACSLAATPLGGSPVQEGRNKIEVDKACIIVQCVQTVKTVSSVVPKVPV
jgi:hypothetical protein